MWKILNFEVYNAKDVQNIQLFFIYSYLCDKNE
jgi:hypothetical protein